MGVLDQANISEERYRRDWSCRVFCLSQRLARNPIVVTIKLMGITATSRFEEILRFSPRPEVCTIAITGRISKKWGRNSWWCNLCSMAVIGLGPRMTPLSVQPPGMGKGRDCE